MGFDIAFIVGHVDDELLCPICADVLEEPVQSVGCEHAYCRRCIDQWMRLKQICPVDRSTLQPEHLGNVSRLMRNMLARLKIKCSFAENGCDQLLPLEEFRAHVASCEHNPKLIVECKKGCGIKARIVPKDKLASHNCVEELRDTVKVLLGDLKDLRESHASQQLRIVTQRRELELMQYYISALRSSNPVIHGIGEQLDRYSLMQWGNALPLANVRNWGSLVSTPDIPMHVMVRESLRASGCPMHLFNMMVDRCHEDRWPKGLATLSARRESQHLYQYVARLLPPLVIGKPCVVVLGGDNTHMPPDLVPALGMVLIFVDGVTEMQQEPLPEVGYA
ncbi:hypothetical protein KR038_008772 [Drosophila bunnanda]|nr:hypothetical protein KR038_008772 [Drosophila bunnanda]